MVLDEISDAQIDEISDAQIDVNSAKNCTF